MTHEPGLVPRPGILDITPYVGGEAKVAGVERPIRLASNESALGPSSDLSCSREGSVALARKRSSRFAPQEG